MDKYLKIGYSLKKDENNKMIYFKFKKIVRIAGERSKIAIKTELYLTRSISPAKVAMIKIDIKKKLAFLSVNSEEIKKLIYV
ncbi:hypothetical protein [Candidatus Karelsulcia muelleri]|uniref:hypothetical protein n=1 Tax=Candidatus Karelsulcia muelleri TaxID=336810 RepID=UPI000D7CF9A6|nr:hypothetical protein [Candidatus Karelsulcia muelleri]